LGEWSDNASNLSIKPALDLTTFG